MKKEVKPIDNFEVYIGTVCTIVMVIIMFLNVVGRYVLKTSIKWAEEVELILWILTVVPFINLNLLILVESKVELNNLIDMVRK